MPTEILPNRTSKQTEENVSRGFTLALVGHVLFFGALGAAAWINAREHHHWGEADPTVGAIQASMVNALPLPPRQKFVDKAVLATDKPSIAPATPPPTPAPPVKATPAPPKATPAPKPDEVLIPKKSAPTKPTPARPAEKEQPVATKRPTTAPTPTPKATTGEASGLQIPQSVTPLRNGTASLTVPDRVFGDRYAYYIRLIAQKINQQKAQDIDPPDSKGKRAMIHFVIDRDGTPTEVEVETRSGSSSLDTSTLRAIQRIDTFGPLPAGDHLPITYVFDSH
jgi:protein TonB